MRLAVRFSLREAATVYTCESYEVRPSTGGTGARTTMRGPIFIDGLRWTRGGDGGKRFDRDGIPVSVEVIK